MESAAPPWEHRLLDLAYGALSQRGNAASPVAVEPAVLDRAYAHCAAITRAHSRTFYLASSLLPPGKQRAVRALYAFCRISDDLVDCAQGDPLVGLEAWRRRSLCWDTLSADQGRPPALSREATVSGSAGNTFAEGSLTDPVVLAWADTRARYDVSEQYAHQLLDAVAQDAKVTRYRTFADLTLYAYGVASTVGLMSMQIIGYSGVEAIPYAVKLGVALQLTNILRDVGEDWRAGRLYLPQEEMTVFGLGEADVAAGRVDDRWRAFVRFQIERNRDMYAEAWPGIAMLHGDGRFAIAAAAELYQAILEDIEAHDFDVLARRAYVSTWDKLRRLPAIWWRTRRL